MSMLRRSSKLLFGTFCIAALSAFCGACGSNGGGGECTEGAITIAFSPMYSAYENSHTYQVPAIVPGVASGVVTWFASDTSIVSLTKDAVTDGIMITAKRTGTSTITAHAGNLCANSLLTITPATPEEWATGSSAYEISCAGCHGETATGPFKGISHTPEQTGGYTDSDLELVIRQGLVPDGGYYDEGLISRKWFDKSHKYPMTDTELKGVIVYLRSLPPTPQTGTADFGGRHRDGGHSFRRDGGSPPDGGGP